MDYKTEEELKIKFPTATFAKGIRSLQDLQECEDVSLIKAFAGTYYNKCEELNKVVDIDIKNLRTANSDLADYVNRLQNTIEIHERVIKKLLDENYWGEHERTQMPEV